MASTAISRIKFPPILFEIQCHQSSYACFIISITSQSRVFLLKKFAAAILSRSPIILGVATILVLLAVGTSIKGNTVDAWRMLHIPSMPYAFADTRTVTDSIDCVLNGTDPFVVPKCQPGGLLYNYPRIW